MPSPFPGLDPFLEHPDFFPDLHGSLYLQKQAEILGSEVHLMEIDLLRGGEHTTPMLLDRLRGKAGPFDYHVSVHRFDQPGRFYIYPWQLADPLPVIGSPLLPGDGEVCLDLQAVFTRCYGTTPVGMSKLLV